MQTELTNEEIRNNIVAEIHDRLAEISTYLKTGLAIFAKLNHEDLERIRQQSATIMLDTSFINCDDYYLLHPNDTVGYSNDKGLYSSEIYDNTTTGKKYEQKFPLGDFRRTAPIDKTTGAFINNSQITHKED